MELQNQETKKISLNVAKDNVELIEDFSQQGKSITSFTNDLYRSYRNNPDAPNFEEVNKNLGIKSIKIPSNVKEISIDVFTGTEKENLFDMKHIVYQGKGLIIYKEPPRQEIKDSNLVVIFKSFKEDNSTEIIYLELKLLKDGSRNYKIEDAVFKKVSNFLELGNFVKERNKSDLFTKKDIMHMMSLYDNNGKTSRYRDSLLNIRWDYSLTHTDVFL